MTIDQKIGLQIQAARSRIQPKITQAQLADRVGLPVGTLKAKIYGRIPWRASEVDAIAHALGYGSASDFLAAAEATLAAA